MISYAFLLLFFFSHFALQPGLNWFRAQAVPHVQCTPNFLHDKNLSSWQQQQQRSSLYYTDFDKSFLRKRNFCSEAKTGFYIKPEQQQKKNRIFFIFSTLSPICVKGTYFDLRKPVRKQNEIGPKCPKWNTIFASRLKLKAPQPQQKTIGLNFDWMKNSPRRMPNRQINVSNDDDRFIGPSIYYLFSDFVFGTETMHIQIVFETFPALGCHLYNENDWGCFVCGKISRNNRDWKKTRSKFESCEIKRRDIYRFIQVDKFRRSFLSLTLCGERTYAIYSQIIALKLNFDKNSLKLGKSLNLTWEEQ